MRLAGSCLVGGLVSTKSLEGLGHYQRGHLNLFASGIPQPPLEREAMAPQAIEIMLFNSFMVAREDFQKKRVLVFT